ncbi:MAG: signal transduction histidine kinase [Verrucomicrobiales bacterium]|jgi:signal transduction histidine kinase
MSKLAADYFVALRVHGEDGLEAHLQMARQIGATAVRMGIDTLGLAKIHESALTAILSAPALGANEEATTTRATIFFNEALTPIEKTHRSALEAAAELQVIHTELDQRSKDLAASQHEVVRETKKRKSVEYALRTSQEAAAELLVESRMLEEELLVMTRRTLLANEAERKQMSLHLQDDIAQAMLGIHVRLLALKAAVSISHEDVAEQITSTERLMAQSVKMISSFANAIDGNHEN